MNMNYDVDSSKDIYSRFQADKYSHVLALYSFQGVFVMKRCSLD